MKRKTKNQILFNIVKRQENEISSLNETIKKHIELENIRDNAWSKYTDDRIREINSQIRASNKVWKPL